MAKGRKFTDENDKDPTIHEPDTVLPLCPDDAKLGDSRMWTRDECTEKYLSSNVTMKQLSLMSNREVSTLARWSKQDQWVSRRKRKEKFNENYSDRLTGDNIPKESLRINSNANSFEISGGDLYQHFLNEENPELRQEAMTQMALDNIYVHANARNYSDMMFRLANDDLKEVFALSGQARLARLQEHWRRFKPHFMAHYSQIMSNATRSIMDISGLEIFIRGDVAYKLLVAAGYQITDPNQSQGSLNDDSDMYSLDIESELIG